jgi:predicted GNAT family acetyltransferase
MSLKLTKFDTAAQFLERTRTDLERDEASSNLLLGLAMTAVRQEEQGVPSKAWFAAIEDERGELALAILLNEVNMIVQGQGSAQEQAAQLAVSAIRQAGLDIPGVVGSLDAAGFIARAWSAAAGREPYVKMNQRIYRLDRVNPVPYSSGAMRLAHMEEVELIADWIFSFAAEVGEPKAREIAVANATDNIRGGVLYVWEDGGRPVTMAKRTRATRNGAVVALVYTPPVCRGKGYATSCVASLSQLLLDEGFRFCALYTDLSNPTSNSIYQKIGYAPVADSIQYRFQ